MQSQVSILPDNKTSRLGHRCKTSTQADRAQDTRGTQLTRGSLDGQGRKRLISCRLTGARSCRTKSDLHLVQLFETFRSLYNYQGAVRQEAGAESTTNNAMSHTNMTDTHRVRIETVGLPDRDSKTEQKVPLIVVAAFCANADILRGGLQLCVKLRLQAFASARSVVSLPAYTAFCNTSSSSCPRCVAAVAWQVRMGWAPAC